MKEKIIMTGAVCATLLWTATVLWAAPARALTNCTATLRLTDGAILVGAKGVSGTLLWGNSAGTETNAFNNAATCVTGNPPVAKKCQLGATGSAQAITPPPLCTVYLKDGAATCSAHLTKCTPGVRGAFSEPTCGNGVAEVGEGCDGADLNGKTCVSQGFLSGTLACTGSCALDTSGCSNDRFVDNGDGTITDNQTKLMWEKKTGTVGGSDDYTDPHNVNNTYTWCPYGTYPDCVNGDHTRDGTLFTDFILRVNGALCNSSYPDYPICTGLAGYSDWRVPTIAELESITDRFRPGCGGGAPCTDPIFEPVGMGIYRATTDLDGSTAAFMVNIPDGDTAVYNKGEVAFARAVRGGL